MTMDAKGKLVSVLALLFFTVGVCAQTSEPVAVLKKTVIDGYEEMQFVEIDKNGSKQSIERLGGNYSYNSEGGYKGLMNIMIFTICAKPGKDNRYAIMYAEIRTDGTLCPGKFCTVSNKIGKYILDFARSARNNYGVTLLTGDQMSHQYKIIAKQKWQKIEDQVTTLYDPHTGTTYRYPKREYWDNQ